MRRLLTFGLLGLAAIGLPQSSIRITFPSAGHRSVWISNDPVPKSPTQIAEAFVDIKTAGSGGYVWVWDKDTGRLAYHAVKDLKSPWMVKPEDFKLLATARLRIEHAGKPVASAQIDTKSVAGTSTTLLTPSDKGEISVYGLSPPAATFGVLFKTVGQEPRSIVQSFQFKLEDAKSPVNWIVSIPDEVDVIEPTKTPSPEPGATGPKPSPAASEPGSLFGRIVTLVVALGVGVALIYLLLKYLRSNSDGVSEKLRQLGVDVPKPAGDDSAPHPIQPIKPEPQQKIILEDSAPISMPATTTLTTGVPRLVMANGDVFELPEGTITLGRELGLDLSLPNESTLSRRHASMSRTGSDVVLSDLGSSNGSFVNGLKIGAGTALRPGDQVQLGEVVFRFEA